MLLVWLVLSCLIIQLLAECLASLVRRLYECWQRALLLSPMGFDARALLARARVASLGLRQRGREKRRPARGGDHCKYCSGS